MAGNIYQVKEQEVADTPVLLFHCSFRDGTQEYWSTFDLSYEGNLYRPRVLAHNTFDLRYGAESSVDGQGRVGISLANADGHFSQIERANGWKGATLLVRLCFFDLKLGVATTNARVMFAGVCTGLNEVTESTVKLSFYSRLSFNRAVLPAQRIQRRCPWLFPTTASQRLEALDGGASGKYSHFYRCGYSADLTGGAGNLNGATPYLSCDYTRANCEQRGMFSLDGGGQTTRRFGGMEFVPAGSIKAGNDGTTIGANDASYNDVVPLLYGTGWYEPPVVWAQSDDRFTRTEVLLGSGPIHGVIKVIANQIEIPEHQTDRDMSATGWYRVVSLGDRNGAFNPDFANSTGSALGNPYGSAAYLSVVLPKQIHNGLSTPHIRVLAQGLQLARYDLAGAYLGDFYSSNPAWAILDILRRLGWTIAELDVLSFAKCAQYCDELIPGTGPGGAGIMIPRFRCNLIVRRRRSAAELVRGICQSSNLYLQHGVDGKLKLSIEGSIQTQQPTKPDGSNSVTILNGGWPAYEFGDGGSGFSGILRSEAGAPQLRIWARPAVEAPNRYSVEFQDEFNLYQKDSLSVLDMDDVVRSSQEITGTYYGVGISNFSHAQRALNLQLAKSILGNCYVEFKTSIRGLHISPGDIITLTYAREGLNRAAFRVLRLMADENYEVVTVVAQRHDDAWYSDGAWSVGDHPTQPAYRMGVPRPLVGSVLDADGLMQFGITEASVPTTDGSDSIVLSAAFTPPPTAPGAVATSPRLSLSAQVLTDGGTLAGGQTLYYAVSAVDGQGLEGPLSWTAIAKLPAGGNTNRVLLDELRFPAGTTAFHVYRGRDPQRLLRIATAAGVAATFTDTGFASQLIGPVDANYYNAKFYWRLEQQPPVIATAATSTTIENSTLSMTPNLYQGEVTRITKGKGEGQERTISSNSTTTLTVASPWLVVPDSTSMFAVAENNWRFGSETATSPAEFEVPNRKDVTVHVVGVAANAQGQESVYESATVTRWKIGGSAGSAVDLLPPGIPSFGLSPAGQGTVEVTGVSFASLENTSTVEAGAISLLFWNELQSPSSHTLAVAVGTTETALDLNIAGTAQPGDVIQAGAELMAVQQVQNGGLRYQVLRGSHASTIAGHSAGSQLYHLSRKVEVLSFPRNFFGSPASGAYSRAIFLPNARIAAGELYVTNSRGSSPTQKQAFTSTSDFGLRTLSGGQFTIQVEGYLAIQNAAAPPLIIEDPHSVRDIFATLKDAPVGAAVQLQIKQNSLLYCSLTIPAGATISNIVNGFGLPPLAAQGVLTLDITSVGQAAGTTPGRDLTVTIRL